MRRLSLDSSRHLHPPYRFPLEYTWDEPRETWRAFRKKLGLPASYDVGEIAKMMIALRKVTEETLGEKIDVAIVTRPDLAALYDEDMIDALEYAGIRYLETCPDCPVQFELWSGFAGNGLGLCNNFHNTDMCEEEMKHMPRWIVLSVLYTDTALYTHEGFLSHAYLFSKYEDFRIDYKSLDWDLGAGSIPDGPDEEQKYWNTVYAHILKLTRAFQILPIQKVIFQGESAHKSRFIEVVKAVVAELQIEVPEFLEEDSVFVAAKGAAEYGYRRLSGLFEQ